MGKKPRKPTPRNPPLALENNDVWLAIRLLAQRLEVLENSARPAELPRPPQEYGHYI